jgi:hypothetical protein
VLQEDLAVEVAVDRGELRERWRLGKQLERQSMSGVVAVQQVTGECQQLAAILGDPVSWLKATTRPEYNAPITEPDWRRGIAAMLLRESKASGRPSGREQCVDLATAVRAYTINAARQDFAESWKGSLEVGKVADLCVLSCDLLTTDAHQIPELAVDLTVFDGQVVFER